MKTHVSGLRNSSQHTSLAVRSQGFGFRSAVTAAIAESETAEVPTLWILCALSVVKPSKGDQTADSEFDTLS